VATLEGHNAGDLLLLPKDLHGSTRQPIAAACVTGNPPDWFGCSAHAAVIPPKTLGTQVYDLAQVQPKCNPWSA
jgi:hypothetical protein